MPLEVTHDHRAMRKRVIIINGRQVDFPEDVRAQDIARALTRRRQRRIASIEADLTSPVASVRLDALRRKRAMLVDELRSIDRQRSGR
jgi:hypothetical protein